MFLVVDGFVAGRSQSPWTNKKGQPVTFYAVSVTDSETGQMAKLDASQELYEKVLPLIGKSGSWSFAMQSRDFQGKTSLTAVDVFPNKPSKA